MTVQLNSTYWEKQQEKTHKSFGSLHSSKKIWMIPVANHEKTEGSLGIVQEAVRQALLGDTKVLKEED